MISVLQAVFPDQQRSDEYNSQSGIIFGGILTSILLLITLCVSIFYRRRFKRLKSAMTNVHYQANHEAGQSRVHHASFMLMNTILVLDNCIYQQMAAFFM